MLLRATVIFIFTSVLSCAFSQGFQDSVQYLAPVIIEGEKIFKKEKAGMKETKLDSLVLSQKINLSLSELLAENTSVFIKNNGRGALSTASFRGTASSHTQVSWNGININSPMLGMVDFSLIPVYVIDAVNLKHGTASIVDKSGGLGGSINTSNNINWNKKFELKYLQAIGSYDTYDEFLQVGGGNDKVHIRTGIYHNYSKNDYTFINRLIPIEIQETGEFEHPLDTNKNAAYTRYGLLQEVYLRLNSKNMLTLRYWGQYADRNIPTLTSSEDSLNSKPSYALDTDHKMVGEWKHVGDKSLLLFRSSFSGKQLNFKSIKLISGSVSSDEISSESTQNSYCNSLSYTYNSIYNLSYKGNLSVNHHDVETYEKLLGVGYHKQRTEYTAFLGAYKELYKRLNISLLLRQEMVDGIVLPTMPFVGFDYRVFKNTDFLVKGNVARNYHLPNLNDLYWQPGGNPNLLPEEGYSAEMGLEYKLLMKKHLLRLELTGYHSDISNWILWVPNTKGYWEPNNVKRVLSQGVEASLNIKGILGKVDYRISGTYAFTPSINYGDTIASGDKSYGKQLVYIPLHSGNLMVNFLYKGYTVSYQHNSYSKRYTTTSNDLSSGNVFPSYFMNDISLSKEFKIRKIRYLFEFKVFNVLGERYHTILKQAMPGRNYLLQLQLQL